MQKERREKELVVGSTISTGRTFSSRRLHLCVNRFSRNWRRARQRQRQTSHFFLFYVLIFLNSQKRRERENLEPRDRRLLDGWLDWAMPKQRGHLFSTQIFQSVKKKKRTKTADSTARSQIIKKRKRNGRQQHTNDISIFKIETQGEVIRLHSTAGWESTHWEISNGAI